MDQTVSTTAANTKEPRHLPGEVGVWVFIIGDMMVFSLFFAVYLYYRSLDVYGFSLSQQQLNLHYGALNTLILLTSSLLVVMALQSVRLQRPGRAPRYFAGAIVCGLAFCAIKFLEYSEKIRQGFTMLSDDFFMFYYVLTGIHFLHLLLGLLVLCFLFFRSRQLAVAKNNRMLLEGGACYWHMVDLLWIVLFPLLYLIK